MKYKSIRQHTNHTQRFTLVRCGNVAVVRDRGEVCTDLMSLNDAKRAMRRMNRECMV